ncbi:putative oxidoreductase [Paenibacillus phyllosphaerae]|uniref:Putative oxidoreductase n=1 Tax=Paenibacillus phyllosphaerae TaxID=274593 RepID=A0A7W5FR60_9BACL|nr:SDR family NAD(P)-dependent oxidoreductase [Paenibacillus phyllosphaerae]MBB3114013.1 putative oxidoreductase [Paenibacillus phyllosphaerae]
MKLSGNTILITGGGSGIGLAFAERFIKAGNTVIVCGRRESVLQDAKEKFPSLITRVSDLGFESERTSTKQDTAIVNVTSGLAFTPLAISPIYSATKAALHSFTISLRHQLSDASVEVIEVAPPAVQTAFTRNSGEPLDAFVDGIFQGLNEGKQEIGYGSSMNRLRMSRDEIDIYVEKMYQAMKGVVG